MKIAIMGDSISEGIGSKKVNYAKILASKYKVKNFALTGTTTEYALDIINDIIEYKPDIVILFYGNVDALPRVKSNTYIYKKIIPKRYKGLGMFDPRALYTSNYYKRIAQKVDSVFRYNLKNTLIKLQGYEQWINIEQFEINYEKLLKIFKNQNIEVITLGNVPISERYFNNATNEYIKYSSIIESLSKKYQYNFINTYKELKKYNLKDIFLFDLYHPNKKGYEIIASLIDDKIKLLYKK